jgi:hypothetical protein
MFGVTFRFEDRVPYRNVGYRKFLLGLPSCQCDRLWLDLWFEPKDGRTHPDSCTAETGHPCGNRCTALPLFFFGIDFLLPATGDGHRVLFVDRWRRL